MNPVIPAKWSKVLWLLYTVATVTVIPSLAFLYGVQSKPATISGFIAVGIAAVLRGLTTNSWSVPPVCLLALLALSLSSCAHDPCHVTSARQIALALRASDSVGSRLGKGELTPLEAEQLLEAHAADAEMGFIGYKECQP